MHLMINLAIEIMQINIMHITIPVHYQPYYLIIPFVITSKFDHYFRYITTSIGPIYHFQRSHFTIYGFKRRVIV